MQILQLIFRALQFLFTIVVLGLSAKLVQGQVFGSPPSINVYVLFLGIWGFIVFAVGVVACFVEGLQGLIMAALDALATFFYIAGGIAMAVKLGVHSCDPDSDEGKNEVWSKDPINAGVVYTGPNGYRYVTDEQDFWGTYISRCRIAQADTAFIFFALAAFMASLAHDLLSGRSKSTSRV